MLKEVQTHPVSFYIAEIHKNQNERDSMSPKTELNYALCSQGGGVGDFNVATTGEPNLVWMCD